MEQAAAEFTGLKVYGADDVLIGEVVGGFNTKANGVLEISRADGSSFLLPLVPEVIRAVDWESGQLFLFELEPFAVENGAKTRLT